MTSKAPPSGSIASLLEHKRLVVLVGEGGVGKTSISAAVAYERALHGKKVGVLTVESARPHSGRLLVRFTEAPDRAAAEALRGSRLLVDAADLPPTGDPDEFHVHQLEGLVVELADGTVVGSVREVVHGPGGELLLLARVGQPDALVPFVRAIVPTVDLEGGRVVLNPPEGLLDLP